jgi:putative transposase
MKKSKFTESQIIGYLRRMEQGEKTADLCREAGVSQLKKLKEMESELSQYKKIVAELTFQNTVLKDVIEKKL